MAAHPLMRALWRPRLLRALQWVEQTIAATPDRVPVAWEAEGRLDYRGLLLKGKADRIDRLADGSFAVVDYKTGGPPSPVQVEQGFAMQLGTLGIMLRAGAFEDVRGVPTVFEYWSLGKSSESDTGFGYIKTPVKTGRMRSGIAPEDFLPRAEAYLVEALDRWILGDEGFTARLNPDASVYNEFDHLMRLDEWIGRNMKVPDQGGGG